jgi:hypothetical protein
MTLPDERYTAVLAAERFMKDLLDPKLTPRIPKELRLRARAVLRHYPQQYYLDLCAEQLPQVFARTMDPLHRWVLQRELVENPQRMRPDLVSSEDTGTK